jgi:hypothetical protein
VAIRGHKTSAAGAVQNSTPCIYPLVFKIVTFDALPHSNKIELRIQEYVHLHINQ